MAQSAGEQGGAESRVATLGGHVEIFVDRPLVELSTPYGGAYVALDRELPAASLFALVLSPQVSPRLPVLQALTGMRLEGMLTPREWAAIDWPRTGRRCFAILYDRPVGGPVLPGYAGMNLQPL